jgi:photosystem II stability/assembly factor-like uncharacterized protein
MSVEASGASVFVNGNGTAYYSVDHGTNWVLLDTTEGMVGTPFWISINGANLVTSTISDTNDAMSLDFLSTNNGKSWSKINLDTMTIGLWDFTMSGHAQFAIGNKRRVVVSLDTGRNWEATNLMDTLTTSLARISNNLFVSNKKGEIYISSNNGETWNLIKTDLSGNPVRKLSSISNNLFALIDGSILLSTNNGVNWTSATDSFIGYKIRSFVTSGESIFAEIAGKGVFHTTDMGASWRDVNSGLFALTTIHGLAINNEFVYAGVGDYLALYRRPLSEMITSAVSMSQEGPLSLTQNHPNPFIASTIITYTIPEHGLVTLDIFDLLGHKIQNLVDEVVDPGQHTIRLTSNKFPVGVYTARLKINNAEREIKMVVGK